MQTLSAFVYVVTFHCGNILRSDHYKVVQTTTDHLQCVSTHKSILLQLGDEPWRMAEKKVDMGESILFIC